MIKEPTIDNRIVSEAVRRGYRFKIEEDGTEKLIRPDGSVAVIARPPINVNMQEELNHSMVTQVTLLP